MSRSRDTVHNPHKFILWVSFVLVSQVRAQLFGELLGLFWPLSSSLSWNYRLTVSYYAKCVTADTKMQNEKLLTTLFSPPPTALTFHGSQPADLMKRWTDCSQRGYEDNCKLCMDLMASSAFTLHSHESSLYAGRAAIGMLADLPEHVRAAWLAAWSDLCPDKNHLRVSATHTAGTHQHPPDKIRPPVVNVSPPRRPWEGPRCWRYPATR